MTSDRGLRNVPSGTGARIDKTPVAKPAPCFEVELPALALVIRAFLPLDSKPSQVFNGRLRIVRLASMGIEIFNPKNRNSSGLGGPLVGRQKSRRMSQMEMTRRRRSNPAAIGNPCASSAVIGGHVAGQMRILQSERYSINCYLSAVRAGDSIARILGGMSK